jgi:hypothetical protein
VSSARYCVLKKSCSAVPRIQDTRAGFSIALETYACHSYPNSITDPQARSVVAVESVRRRNLSSNITSLEELLDIVRSTGANDLGDLVYGPVAIFTGFEYDTRNVTNPDYSKTRTVV